MNNINISNSDEFLNNFVAVGCKSLIISIAAFLAKISIHFSSVQSSCEPHKGYKIISNESVVGSGL